MFTSLNRIKKNCRCKCSDLTSQASGTSCPRWKKQTGVELLFFLRYERGFISACLILLTVSQGAKSAFYGEGAESDGKRWERWEKGRGLKEKEVRQETQIDKCGKNTRRSFSPPWDDSIKETKWSSTGPRGDGKCEAETDVVSSRVEYQEGRGPLTNDDPSLADPRRHCAHTSCCWLKGRGKTLSLEGGGSAVCFFLKCHFWENCPPTRRIGHPRNDSWVTNRDAGCRRCTCEQDAAGRGRHFDMSRKKSDGGWISIRLIQFQGPRLVHVPGRLKPPTLK